ncbi:MAG: hypothetical protein NVS3B25_24020 [Hymenobacter sp.]
MKGRLRPGGSPAGAWPALGNVAQPVVVRLLEAVLADEPFHSVSIDDPLLPQLLEAYGVRTETGRCTGD